MAIDVWEGLDTAPTYERGAWFSDGFEGTVSLERCLLIDTQEKGDAFIVEVMVRECVKGLESDPVTSPRSWFQKMVNKKVAWPNIKAFLQAVLGLSSKQPSHAQNLARLDGCIKGLAALATGEGNILSGFLVGLSTKITKKKDGDDFTLHNWSPFQYAAKGMTPPDVERILAMAEQETARRSGGPGGRGGGGYGPPPVLGAPPAWGPPPAPPAAWVVPPGGQLSPDGKSYWAPGMTSWTPVPAAPPAVAGPPPFVAPKPPAGPPPFTLPPGAQKSPDGKMYWAPGMASWTPIPSDDIPF